MKFCPSCGNKLADDARFCNKCGAKQPELETSSSSEEALVHHEEVETRHEEIREERRDETRSLSPRERYDRLIKEDECFREIVKANRIISLTGLKQLLVTVVWLVALLTPVAVFTGINMSTYGANLLNTLGKTTPLPFSPFDLIGYNTMKAGTRIDPNNQLTSLFPMTFLIVGIIITVLFVLTALLNTFTRRGYFLRTYEAGKKVELIKSLCRVNWAPSLFAIFVFVPSFQVFLNASTMEYKDDKTYLFGRIEPLQSGFVTVCIVAGIVFAILLASSIVITKLATKKLRSYL